jgi:hypothetical protein
MNPGGYLEQHPPIQVDDVIHVTISYPRIEGHPKAVQITFEDVRAVSPLLVYFDYGRNGYVIAMDLSRERDGYMETVTTDVEVAFVPAWNLTD